MAQNILEIILIGKDKATAQLKQNMRGLAADGKKTSEGISKGFVLASAAILLAVKAVDKLIKSFANMGKDLIGVSSKVEQLRVRLEVLLGSVEKGNQVFEDMKRLAGQVPKTYDEIMESATALAGVVRKGTTEINQLMPIILDISASTGIGVQEVTSQIIRMYSAGASAADLFRDRGITAALGFQVGVRITAEETMKILIDQWEDATGKYVGATKKLATTWVGAMSMMEDAWFTFRADVGEEMFATAKADLNALLSLIDKSKKKGGDYNKIVEETSEFYNTLVKSAKDFVITAVIGGAQVVDVYNDLAFHLQRIVNFYDIATIGAIKLLQATTEAMTLGTADTSALTEEIAIRQEYLAAGLQTEQELREQAKIDYSTIVTERLDLFFKMINEEKKGAEDLAKTKEDIDKAALIAKKKIIAAEKAARDAAAAKTLSTTLGVSSSMLGMLSQTLEMAQGETQKFAGALKVVRIMETIVNTATGIMRAFADFPYPVALGISGLIGAMGATQVGVIASQGFAEGTDSVPASLTPGEMIFPKTMADSIRRGDIVVSGRGGFEENQVSNNTREVNINFTVNNPNFRNEENMEEVFEELSNMLNREAERL